MRIRLYGSSYIFPGSICANQYKVSRTKLCHPEAAFFGDVDFKMFIKKQDSKTAFDCPPFLPKRFK